MRSISVGGDMRQKIGGDGGRAERAERMRERNRRGAATLPHPFGDALSAFAALSALSAL